MQEAKKKSKKQASRKKTDNNCTPTETKFVHLFLITGNQRRAAQDTFKTKDGHHADNTAKTVLARPRVKAYIKKLMDEANGTQVDIKASIEKLMNEIELIAFSSPVDFAEAVNLPEAVTTKLRAMGGAARAISEIEISSVGVPGTDLVRTDTKLKFHPKVKALDMLAKKHRLYADVMLSDPDTPANHWGLPDNNMGKKE